MKFVYIFLIIFVGRITSSLLGYEFLNTDEFVIGSKALRILSNSFNFFELDGDTSGVLNALFLTWPFFFNIDITYFSIRISAVFVTSLTLYFLLKTIKEYINESQSMDNIKDFVNNVCDTNLPYWGCACQGPHTGPC